MIDPQDAAFRRLFSEACEKCFGHFVASPLSETDARALSNAILQKTGLLLGVKSLKNYSIYIFDAGPRRENPSIATLDTLARYVLDAPSTDDVKRRDTEAHHPYWFQYKGSIVPLATDNPSPLSANESIDELHELRRPSKRRRYAAIVGLLVAIGSAVVLFQWKSRTDEQQQFMENFNSVVTDSLERSGWVVQRPDDQYWNERQNRPGYLTLYTLIGDNWPGSDTTVPIKNLLVRTIDCECFAVEVQFSDLRPTHNWQQTGILLAEDSAFRNRVLRLSFSYNDFFGGYRKEPEIIIQGLSSVASSHFSKPEEFAHIPILTLERGTDSLVWNNLRNAALKIEKKGRSFRFLFNTGASEAFAFKEAVHGEYEFNPTYVGLFATQGLAVQAHVAPVFVDRFSITRIPCNE